MSLRQNVFFGIVPKATDRRKGPPRDQCHSERAVDHARHGFVHVKELSNKHCDGKYVWNDRLLAYQVCISIWPWCHDSSHQHLQCPYCDATAAGKWYEATLCSLLICKTLRCPSPALVLVDAQLASVCVGVMVTLRVDVAQCPLFARKFSNSSDTVDAVMDALHSCEQPTHILKPCNAVTRA